MNAADIAAVLKNVRPHKLRVVMNDNNERTVAMQRGRNRWHGTAQTIDAMPWTEVYCLDGTGAVCAAPIKREDGAPAAELETLGGKLNDTQITAATLAQLVREVHRTATSAAVELATKLRKEAREEMADLVKGYEALAKLALNRGTGFEERANELQAENDELREMVIELQGHQRNTPRSDESPEERRERMLVEAITGLKGEKKTPDAASDGGGKNGEHKPPPASEVAG